MSKNKLKFIIFVGLFFIFLFIDSNFVSANDYNAIVNGVDDLIYGNNLKNVNIYGVSDVEGEFSFYDKDKVLDQVGEIELEIIFVAKDSNEIQKITIVKEVLPRKISVNFKTPIYKQYDATTNINLPEYSYVGILNDEVRIEGELTGELNASYVGEGVGVTLSGITIEGEKSDCYYLELLEHTARIYPSFLEKYGNNTTKIILDEGTYIDINSKLKVVSDEEEVLVNDKYTSFKKFSYNIYDHRNNKLDIDSKIDVIMVLDKEVVEQERLEVFELKSDGSYEDLEYKYKDGKIYFTIDSDSQIVFAKRNIEYHFIILFSGILLFYLVLILVYMIRNSKMKSNKNY